MKRFLQNQDLRKLFMGLIGLVILFLVTITGLAVKQYFLYRHCNNIVSISDRFLFQFTSIKEHINESLLNKKIINIKEISEELQGFDSNIRKIAEDFLIPEEFKAIFVSQVDLVGLVVQLRTVRDPRTASPEQLTQLNISLRSISSRLRQFDQILTVYTQQLLLGLHKIVAGTLAVIVFIISMMLFLINRYISEPIIELYQNVKTTPNNMSKNKGLHTSIRNLQELVFKARSEQKHLYRLLQCLDNVHQILPESMNHPDAWETLCQALQTNPDYFLVWIGRPLADASFPDPVTGCGCTSSSPLECKQTIDHLVKYCRQEGGLCDSARKAAEQQTSVITTISTMNMPETLLLTMPAIPQHVVSASFPVAGKNALNCVVTLYSAEKDCFGPLEIGMLNILFQHIVWASPAKPENENNLFELYTFSVAGALTANLAHEMINISNGALNYSQALLDLSGDTPGSTKEERLLLEKLHLQEKKMADLSESVHQLTRNVDRKTRKITLSLLINCSIQLLEKRCKQEKITIQTELAPHCLEINVPVADVRMVFLTVLHRAIQHLTALPIDQQHPVKTLTIQAGQNSGNDQNIWITVDHFPDKHSELLYPRHDGPWPAFNVCEQIIHSLKGTMTIEPREPKTSICRITLPTIA